jgi:hypothetical protein
VITAEPGRFLLVQLEAGLHRSRHVGIWHNVMGLPGVESVTDLAATTQETLDVILMHPDLAPMPKRARAKRQRSAMP